MIDYSRNRGRNWDYSEKAVELLKEYKASFFFSFFVVVVERYSMCRATSWHYFVVLIVMEMVYDLLSPLLLSVELLTVGR